MNKTMLICLSLFGLVPFGVFAQVDSTAHLKPHLHASPIYIGAGASIPFGVSITGGGFSRKGWGGTLSGNWMWRGAKNQPSNYNGGNNLFGDGRDYVENDKMRVFSIRISKQFAVYSDDILLGVETGPSFVKTQVADNFIYNPNACTTDPFFGATFCAPNYDYKIVTQNSMGWSIKGKLGVNLAKVVEFEIGILSNFNKQWSFFGLEFLGTLGVFRQ